MTNKEKFVEAFGESSYNNLACVAKEANAIDIFVWLLDEYRELCKSRADDIVKMIDMNDIPKESKKILALHGGIPCCEFSDYNNNESIWKEFMNLKS